MQILMIIPDGWEVIEGLVMNCVNDAQKKVKEEAANSLGKLSGGGQIPGIENILKNFMICAIYCCAMIYINKKCRCSFNKICCFI